MKTAFDELIFSLNVVNAIFEIVEGKQRMLEIKVFRVDVVNHPSIILSPLEELGVDFFNLNEVSDIVLSHGILFKLF